MSIQTEIEGFRLAPQQKRLWQFSPGIAARRAWGLIRLSGRIGPLEREALRNAVQEVAARHEALRTRFACLPGMSLPIQVVAEPGAVEYREMGETDLRGLAADARGSAIERLCRDEESAGSGEALSRFTLIETGPDEALLLAGLPALTADPVSFANLARELALEIGRACDARHPVAEEPVQYVQFSEWQNDLMEGEGEGYEGAGQWRGEDFSALSRLRLPGEEDLPPAPAPSDTPLEEHSWVLPAERAEALRAFAGRHGSTLETVLLAAWQALLGRLADETEVVVAVRRDGRVYDEMREGLGLYARWPLVACRFAEAFTFLDVLDRVTDKLAWATQWQEYFSWDLVAAGAGALLPIGFELWDETALAEHTAGGLRIALLRQRCFTEGFRLLLSCQAGRDLRLRLRLEHDPARFSADEVRRLAERFETFLEAALRAPGAPVAELDLLGRSERQELLVSWNGRFQDVPAGATAPALFAAQADRTPDRPAVAWAGGEISFRELDRRANRLARHLRSLGVGAESRVAFCLERGPAVIEALLAIWKAGGAYVPLDPGQPTLRLAAVLREAGIATAGGVLLTQESLVPRLPDTGARVIRLDVAADMDAPAAHGDERLALEIEPGSLAYVLYTSGSTGVPKGVMIRHGAVVNLALALDREIYAGERGPLRVSVNAPLSFDASVKQVIQLLFGRTLVLVPDEVRPDGAALLAFLAEQRVEALDCTPAQLGLLLAAGLDAGQAPALRRVLVGGEAVDRGTWQRIAACAGIEFFNVYGPTECTVDATVCRVRSDPERPSLGRPVANARVYLLDSRLLPLPAGMAGEICIGGAGVARGYLGRGELTAERFVPDPFAPAGQGGSRLYRTGDLARFLPGGRLEFLDRLDRLNGQVKLRGYRIELGEIEAALVLQAEVSAAVVLLREDRPGDRRLVAYVVPRPGAAPARDGLRAALAERLPEPMIPAAFVVLDAFPLTRHGKVDRRALPAPEEIAGDREEILAPGDPFEEIVAQIWAEVLDLPQVGVEQSFFELGGHSLLATQVMSRVRQAFQVELPLRALFEAPTVAALAREVEGAMAAEAQGSADGALLIEGIERTPAGEEPVLSFAQQRLWFLAQLEPDSPFYNSPAELRLAGPLDAAALARSLGEIVRRHEVLRTVFRPQGGRPVPVLLPAGPLALPLADLSSLPDGERQAEALRLAGAHGRRPFDLERGPLLRACLLRLAEREHRLLFALHHIVSDAWSAGVMMRELAALYAAPSSSSPLPELPVQYADFARWQRRWLTAEVRERQLAWWEHRLAAAPAVLELPADRPRTAARTTRGAVLPCEIAAADGAALRVLARREGGTLFMALLAGLLTLFRRLTGQQDLVVGSPVANRNRRETEDLIGFFVNTLVLRVDLGGDPSFRELIARVRETALGAYAHQDLPFDLLVERLQPERSLSRSPLFQVLFALQNAPRRAFELPGLDLELLPVDTGSSRFDWTLWLTDHGSGIAGQLEYSTDLFDRATMERWLGHLATLLTAAAADPGRRLAELPLLTDSERGELLAWGQGPGDGADDRPLGELFERQVARTPQAPALEADGETLTYRELSRRANQLARHLCRLGAGEEKPVALLLERSAAMIVATVAVVQAGGVYVPVDPVYPQERIAQMLEDAARLGPVTLVTRRSLLDRVPAALWTTSPAACLLLDEQEPEGAPDDLLPAGARPDSTLYAVFTSGSTGRPKGIPIPHRAVTRLVCGGANFLQIEAADRVAQVSNPSFDAATFEIWGALLNGACLVVLEREVTLAPGRFAEELRRRQVSILFLTTALFNQVAREAPDGFSSLRCLLFGGEAVDPGCAGAVLAAGPPRRLLHVYGPTESTAFAAWHPVERVADGALTVPIGGPLSRTGLYVVDEHLGLVPPGAPGELLLGGDGLSPGYLASPALTASRFVPDPLGDRPGARLYRTGDRVRRGAENGLEFLGRLDQQVKIRGFRIEPGEIEAVLARHPDVRQAAVVSGMAQDARPGELRLVAYYSGGPAGAPPPAALRDFLRARLPEFMIPAVFVPLPELPLNRNGKIDRAALPAPEQSAGEEYAAPRTPVEEILEAIWAEVLGRDRIGRDESFFDAGGHSLLATQVLSRLRDTFGTELPLRALYEAPSLAGLAATIDSALAGALAGEPGHTAPPPVTPVPRTARMGDLPLSFAQERLWFLAELAPESAAYNIPAPVRIRGNLDGGVLERVLAAVVRRHEPLRTSFLATFLATGGRPVQRIAPEGGLVLPRVDLSRLGPAERAVEGERLARAAAARPFRLDRAPLLRAALVRLDAREHLLLLTVHHIVSDGWSMGVLVREVGELYAAFAAGRPSPLPDLPVQAADVAVWQRAWLQGAVLETQLAWWRERLAGMPHVLDLPADRPRPAGGQPGNERADSRRLALSPALSAAVLAFARRCRATPFMALLAAFQALLFRLSGQDDLCVGSPVAGRNRTEIEPLIGLFVNTLALRARLAGQLAVGELMAQARETCLGALSHQDVPFERLVEELAPERDLSRSPLVQVMLTLERPALERLELPGLSFELLPLRSGAAKLDLNLALTERESGLTATLDFRTDLFEAATADRLLRCFATLLAGFVADAERPLSGLELLDAAERRQILLDWSRPAIPVTAQCGVSERFAEQAAAHPDAVAVVAGAERLTYAELARRTALLARHLRSRGVGPEVRVALFLERTPELVAALLATLEAGGAYVPLDVSHPPARLAWLLADTAAPLVLTLEHLRDRLPIETGRAEVLCLDGLAAWSEPTGAGPEISEVPDPDQAAYILYTSGSTGTPKGVVIPHRGLASYLGWAIEAYGAAAGNGAPVHSPAGFDLTVTSLLGPLLAGRPVTLVPEAAGIEGLGDALRAGDDFSLVKLTPAHLEVLSRTLPAAEAAGKVRCLVVGGEALPAESLAFWREHAPRTRIVNEYGPTETVVGCSAFAVGPGDPLPAGVLPIGRPIANARLHVLDRWLQPLPAGIPGELCIGGDGLARGYRGRPELTAQSFVPDPFAALHGRAGERLYRSGDLARFQPDGVLECLGRLDHQVKLRGYRIEPGEIEAVLLRHPAVRESAAVVREDPQRPGDRRLVAWVALREGIDATPEELLGWLGERLPAPLVPSALAVLPALPLTAHGKVDRKALAQRDVPQSGAGSGMDAAAAPAVLDPVEEMLASFWSDLLGREHFERGSHFFQLGGHSLLATRLISRVREVFAIEVPLRTVFELPVLADFARRIRSLLAQGDAAEPPLRPVPRSGDLPLSFAQQRLWFLAQMEPDSPFYNSPGAMRLTGTLDVAAWRAAWQELVQRHEVLRTAFPAREGRPAQRIAPALTVSIPVIDLSALPSEVLDGEAGRLARAEALQPFDLAAGPLLRLALLRSRGGEHLLLITFHHIVTDGWSRGVLVRELTALYTAFVAGKTSPLPPLPIQYADFASWQRLWMAGAEEAQLAYWRGRLAGLPAVIELPADRPRPAVRTPRGQVLPVSFSAELAAALHRRARQEGVTLFMLLLAGFQTLLGRLSGSTDVAVGSPIANRNRREIEGLIGFFVNSLVLRTDLDGDPAFRAALARVRETCLGAYAHQDLPFERLVDELAPARSLGHTPLFQVVLSLQGSPWEAVELPGLRLEPMESGSATSRFDLTLAFEERGAILGGIVEHSTDLFDRTTVERWLGHLATLLAAAAGDPQQRLSELPLLTAAERSELLAWGQGPGDGRLDRPLAELFARQVALTPEAPALAAGGETLTYRELSRRARRLAHRLRRLGAGPERPAVLLLERSAAMIVATLAVALAGGVYVPIDPDYPRERVDQMLAGAATLGPVTLVTRRELLDRWPAAPAARLLLDGDLADGELADGDLEDGESGDGLPAMAGPDSTLYAVFTSGSTGRPKGIPIPQRAVTRLVCGADFVQIGPADRVAQVSNPSFDAATFEIWGALLNGACLVVLEREVTLEPRLFAAELRRQGASILFLTTALFQQIAREVPDGFSPLRCLLFGGEAVDPADVRAVLAAGPPRRLLHVYGPTESTTFASWYEVERVEEGARTVPIGGPLSRTDLYVLDEHLGLAPPGVPGELCIGGDGLTSGYLAAPELTAVQLVPDPQARRPGARLYRTGDRVRRLPGGGGTRSGGLEFLGRLDHQVKIRGFRIELGEIEAVLGRHPEVRRVAVLAREDRPGERRLVAYYDGPAAPSATSAGAALRDFLRARLPEFMIPAAFVSLPELALNRNGKVDRAALPPPESLAEATEAAPLHALSPAEELLLGIWREVLDNPAFGPDESFFEAGGHSLLATQVVSRVRRVFGVEIPLRALFEAPTVSGLARRIEDESGVTVPAVQRVPREGREAREAGLPLSYAQQRLWFLDQLLADRSSYNVPSALRFSGRLNVPVLERALGEVFRRHEVLRTTFQEAGGVPVQVPGEAPRGALPVVDLSGLAAAQPGAEAAEAARLQAAEAARPFDLARGPLLRAAVLRLGAEEHLGLFTMHHIASDGWSMGVLVREVGALYAAFSAGQPSPLPELPLQYADYAVWQRRWMRGEVLEEHLAAWRRRLHGPLPPFPLPLDRPRPAVPGSRGGRRSFALPAALLQELKALSRHEDATLYMTLLAAFSALLARTGGQTDVLVGSAVAGRSLAETEGLIGFFINMLPMRVDLSGNPRFRELLARVRDTALDAYTHQHLPFDKLVEELQPDRGRTGQAPLFQIAFGLQNAQTPETLELPGVAVTALPPEHEVARYDLTVWARETGDGLDVLWTYSAELFEPATVANLHGRFEAVLRQVAERPGIHLDALEILGDEERRAQAAEQAGQRQEKHRKLLRLQPKAFKQPPADLRGGEETS